MDRVRCTVEIDRDTLPYGEFSFVSPPREGEAIFVDRGEGVQMFKVIRVHHFATDANPQDPAASIRLIVIPDSW